MGCGSSNPAQTPTAVVIPQKRTATTPGAAATSNNRVTDINGETTKIQETQTQPAYQVTQPTQPLERDNNALVVYDLDGDEYRRKEASKPFIKQPATTTLNEPMKQNRHNEPKDIITPTGIAAVSQTNEQSQRRYKKLQMIDKGAYGQVFKGIDTVTNETVAIKYIEVKGNFEEVKKEVASLKKEIALLKKLNHPNIVKYFDFDISEDKSGVDIILEYVPNGSIRMTLNKQKKGFDESKTANYTKQVLEGLRYLHANNIIHRDLKGANLLLDSQGNAKVADFGTAKQQLVAGLRVESAEDIAQMNKSLKGTPNWMAPEVIARTGHTISADIWSIGCVVIEMLTGRPPYHGLTAKEVFSKIEAGILPDFPKYLSEEAKDFLANCFQTDSKMRSTASQLLDSAFIKGRKLTKIASQDTLLSQEELLRQIDTIQLQVNTQQYPTTNSNHQQSTYRTPLNLSPNKDAQYAASSTLRSRPNNYNYSSSNNNNNGPARNSLKQQYTFEEYQNTHLSRMNERGRVSLTHRTRATQGGSPIDDIDNLTKELQSLQGMSSSNYPRSMMEFRQPSGQRSRTTDVKQFLVNDPQNQFTSKGSEPSFTNPDKRLPGRRILQPSSNLGHNLLAYKPFVKTEVTQPLRTSIHEFRNEEISSMKSISLSRKGLLAGDGASSSVGSRLGMRQQPNSYNEFRMDSGDIEIELPNDAKTVRFSEKKGAVPLDEQNPFLKHENTVINSKLNPDRMAFSKKSTQLASDHDLRAGVGAGEFEKSGDRVLNQVINTEFTQRNRTKAMQEQEEVARQKELKRLAWEEELKKELEYQRTNPISYHKQ